MLKTQSEVLAMFPWGPAKEIHTKRGPRMLRKCDATPELDKVFFENRIPLAAAGVSRGEKWKQPGFEFCLWGELPAEVKAERQAAVEASRAVDAAVEIPRPDGLEYMPFQKAGIAFAGSRPGVLVADEMGLGKTIQAIGVINNDPDVVKVLVICPASLKINWLRELNKWLVRPLSVGVADAKTWPTTDVVIVNYDVVHKWKVKANFYWDLLVVDEAHFLKNSKAKRTQFICGYRAKRNEDPSLTHSGIPAKRQIFMTGTPIVNRPAELWPLISRLDPKTWSNFYGFAKRYCGAGFNGYGFDMAGASNLEELQDRLRQTIMVRRLKKDVLTELPPKRRQIMVLENDDFQGVLLAERNAEARNAAGLDRYAELKADAEMAKANDDAAAYKAAVAEMEKTKVAFDEISRVRHETALAKVEACAGIIAGELETVPKLIVFAHHLDVIAKYMASLAEFKPVKITGEDAIAERQAAVDRFQNDPACRVIICSIRAAGVGLTLTAATEVVFAELDWTPGAMSQAEDRAHRIGQTEMVLVKHLVLDGSLDARMAETLVAKQEIIDRAMDAKERAEAAAPVAPLRGKAVEATAKEYAEAKPMPFDQMQAVRQCLGLLAGVCDGARQIDGAGFNKVDAAIGKRLATLPILTPRQALLGAKLVAKYRRQLPEDLLTKAKG